MKFRRNLGVFFGVCVVRLSQVAGFVVFTTLALFASGCGPVMYAMNVMPASSTVEEASRAGARSSAPFEFTMAQEFLKKAHEEAGEGNYQTAQRYSAEAEEFAVKARDIARRAMHSSARSE